MAVFGFTLGGGPVSEPTGMACFTGGTGMSMVHGVVIGLAQVPQPLDP